MGGLGRLWIALDGSGRSQNRDGFGRPWIVIAGERCDVERAVTFQSYEPGPTRSLALGGAAVRAFPLPNENPPLR